MAWTEIRRATPHRLPEAGSPAESGGNLARPSGSIRLHLCPVSPVHGFQHRHSPNLVRSRL